MKVKKVYNNNILLAENEQLLEVILLGRGIAFKKKAGDKVDVSKIEKTFILDSPELYSSFVKLLQEVPLNHVKLVEKIVNEAQEELKVKFHDSIYIALTDHMSYALSRYKMGIEMKNALLWEIKRIYEKEYKAACHSLEIIQYYEGIEMSADEAGFIALHFVNAQQDGEKMKITMTITEIVNDVLNIVKYHFNIEYDQESLSYSRFIRHIRYFARLMLHNKIVSTDDDFLYKQVKNKCPQEKVCVDKIKVYFDKKFNYKISKEEMVYFMIHINRIIKYEKKG
ncbi:PRD domain-containing protein [Iocasia frigidifontis]|uniref:PRD domain-containing protein n=1 Tax=Iocasia fonsfrigidae TaxID=2682810 RepID=A0A8A7KC19_9FIRM|nr:PRD domain-containing protein [Iocasia fonsfrigidae]QTL98991.1 PRD domain-containing protein [Iocasia fonsfrigidae]